MLSTADVVIIILVAVAVALAVIFSVRNRHRGCNGNCYSCSGCDKNKKQ